MPSKMLPVLEPLAPLAAGLPQDRPSFRFNFERGESSRAAAARSSDPSAAGPSRVVEDTIVEPPVQREEFIPEAPHSPSRTESVPVIPEEPMRVPKTEPGWIPMPSRYTPTHRPFDPADFENQRYIHDRINRNLSEYKKWERWDTKGYISPTDAVPSFYWGVGAYPGGVFEEVGVDPTTWGRDYGLSYGGAGGQFYPATWHGGSRGPPEDAERGESSGHQGGDGDGTGGGEAPAA